MLRCRFLVRLKYARLSAILLFKEPPSQARRSDACGRGAPERKDRKNKKNRKNRKDRDNRKNKNSCRSCRSCPSLPPLFTGIFFDTRAPRAHLKPALRIVGGKATDLAVAAGESCKAVKKRRRQTLCLRSIRFRLCDSRLRQRCGAWLLRHFCHQKWQRKWAT